MMNILKLLISLIVIFYYSPIVLAEENCPSFKNEEKCEGSNTCTWDKKSKSCKEISVDDIDTKDPMEEPDEQSTDQDE